MSTVLNEAWSKKYAPAPTLQVQGVLSVSFSYWQGFGGRIVAGEVTMGIEGSSEKPNFRSEVKWPHDNYESFVIEGIADAMQQFSGVPVGVSVTLKEIGWDEVNSCGTGFYFAAREAMFSALRIMKVPRVQP